MFTDIAMKVLPIWAIASPLSKFFVLYLIITASIGYVLMRLSGRNQAQAIQYLFPKRIFLHPSAKVDYQMALINHLIFAFVVASYWISTSSVASWTGRLLNRLFGVSHLGDPSNVVLFIFAFVLLVVYDLANYIDHRLQHRNRILWELHKPHHSALVLTPFTALRVHPLSALFAATVISLMMGPVNGLFIYLYGADAAVKYAVPLNFFFALHYTIGVYHLQHSHLWLIFPRPFRQFLVSPALHMIHHSSDPKHYDKNFAFVFTIWDRWFGTFYDPADDEVKDLVLGLRDEVDQQAFETVEGLYLHPMRNLIKPTTSTVDEPQ